MKAIKYECEVKNLENDTSFNYEIILWHGDNILMDYEQDMEIIPNTWDDQMFMDTVLSHFYEYGLLEVGNTFEIDGYEFTITDVDTCEDSAII